MNTDLAFWLPPVGGDFWQQLKCETCGAPSHATHLRALFKCKSGAAGMIVGDSSTLKFLEDFPTIINSELGGFFDDKLIEECPEFRQLVLLSRADLWCSVAVTGAVPRHRVLLRYGSYPFWA